MPRITDIIQEKREETKKKVNLYISADLWEKVEKYAKQFGYGRKRKSEFVEKLLIFSLEQLEKELRRKKKESREESGHESFNA
jgi:hypothetical protein